MPTLRPRVNVTVTEEQHALLLELGALEGRSASSYLRQMLDLTEPSFRAALKLAKMQREVHENLPEKLRNVVTDTLKEYAGDDPDQFSLLEHISADIVAFGSGEAPPARSGQRGRTEPHPTDEDAA